MGDINIMGNRLSFPKMIPSLNKIVDSQISVSPLILRGEFVPDLTSDIVTQAENILLHYGIKIPEDISLQKFNMPAGLSAEQQFQWTMNSAKLAGLEFKATSDKSSIMMSSIRKTVIEDGRSHITSIYDLIGNINNDYQKNFGEITKNATKYMESLNSALGKMSKNLESASNGEIKLFKNRVFDDLNESMKSYYKLSKFQSSKEGNNNAFEVGYTKILNEIYTGNSPNFNINKDKLVEYMEPISSFDYSDSALSFWEKN